jgi:aspartate-semialdehyde dehydrogenase
LLLQYAFNLFSHNSGMDVEVGYNEEELKLVKETKKIWGVRGGWFGHARVCVCVCVCLWACVCAGVCLHMCVCVC